MLHPGLLISLVFLNFLTQHFKATKNNTVYFEFMSLLKVVILGNQPKKLIDQEMIDISAAPCHLYLDNIAIIKN